MQIIYPSYIKWSIDLSHHINPNTVILSKSFSASTKTILKDLENHHYVLNIEKIDRKLLEEFIPVYKKMISKKKNSVFFDVIESVLGNQNEKIAFAAVLRKNNKLIGATLFRIRDNTFSMIYKVFPYQLDFFIKTNLTTAIDYFCIQYSINSALNTYILGKDSNFFGEKLNIGLARYKISIGALPYISKHSELVEIDVDTYKPEVDSLIFYNNKKDQTLLNKALLYTNLLENEIKNKYGALFKQEKIEFQIINY
jgi:hypothetical protein